MARHHPIAPVRVAILSLVVGAVAVVAVLISSLGDDGSDGGTLRAQFTSVVGVLPGQRVRLAGTQVGKVESVSYAEGRPVVELGINDDGAWPLPRGTTARIRYGATLSYGARIIDLDPGPRSAEPLPDGGILSTGDTVTPVEFDQVFNMFNRRTRRNLGALIANGAGTLRRRAGDLRRALADTPPGLGTSAAFMRELGADRAALSALVTSGHRVTRAVASRENDLRALLDSAAATFDEFADHNDDIRASLDRAPTTLRVTRSTLARLDTSLVELDALATDIAPGARELRRLAPVALRTSDVLDRVAPLAASTFRRARQSAPGITRLLDQGGPFLGEVRGVLDGLRPAFACLRPYGPEIAGTLGTWAGFTKYYDDQNHHSHTFASTPPFGPGTSLTAEQIEDTYPGIDYGGLPRPPGYNASQPFFQPQCGVTPESLDPAQDPETQR